MQTLFILEFQAQNSGSCTMTPPLGYTDETACLNSVLQQVRFGGGFQLRHAYREITTSEGEVWRGYKQTLRHGHEVE